MEKEEIVKYMLQRPEIEKDLRISSILNVLARTMIQKGWFTEQEFSDMVEKDLKNVAEATVNSMTEETRKSFETAIKFSKLFGKEG